MFRYLALESLCLMANSEFSAEAVRKHQETVINSLKVRVLWKLSILWSSFNPLSANSMKWSNTLKFQFENCLSVFDHFVCLTLKGLGLNVWCPLKDHTYSGKPPDTNSSNKLQVCLSTCDLLLNTRHWKIKTWAQEALYLFAFINISWLLNHC